MGSRTVVFSIVFGLWVVYSMVKGCWLRKRSTQSSTGHVGSKIEVYSLVVGLWLAGQ